MKDYIPKSEKAPHIKKLINEALDILDSVGIPLTDLTLRRLEKMALAFLAVADVTKSWKDAKGTAEFRTLRSREVLHYMNAHFEENIKDSSYDDIRRKDLKLLVDDGLILNSAFKVNAATSDSTRGYSLADNFKTLLTFYNTKQWVIRLEMFTKNRQTLAQRLERERNLPKVKITLPNGKFVEFTQGAHNELQREIIEQFLPRFGGEGCIVLYLGDTKVKYPVYEKEILDGLGVFDVKKSRILPDIIAYNPNKNWLFLIEAFNVTGTMDDQRILKLQEALKNCTADIIYVTAFISRTVFNENVGKIGWESEVWTADKPDHMVHFNGHKFLGSMSPKS